MCGKLFRVEAFSKAVFHGFILKPGYFYGTDSQGRPVATSSCVKNGMLCLYTRIGNCWVKSWMPLTAAAALYPDLSIIAE